MARGRLKMSKVTNEKKTPQSHKNRQKCITSFRYFQEFSRTAHFHSWNADLAECKAKQGFNRWKEHFYLFGEFWQRFSANLVYIRIELESCDRPQKQTQNGCKYPQHRRWLRNSPKSPQKLATTPEWPQNDVKMSKWCQKWPKWPQRDPKLT